MIVALVCLLVTPVSALEKVNYWNVNNLSHVETAGCAARFVGSDIVVECLANYQWIFDLWHYNGLQKYAGQTLTFSYDAVSSGSNTYRITFEFFLDGKSLGRTIFSGPPVDFVVPERFDYCEVVLHGNTSGTAVEGDTVTYSNIQLLGDRPLNSDSDFASAFGGAFGFLGDVTSGLFDVAFRYRFVIVAVMMPFFIWLLWHVVQLLRNNSDITVPSYDGRFKLNKVNRRTLKGSIVVVDGQKYVRSLKKQRFKLFRGKHWAKKHNDKINKK